MNSKVKPRFVGVFQFDTPLSGFWFAHVGGVLCFCRVALLVFAYSETEGTAPMLALPFDENIHIIFFFRFANSPFGQSIT